MEKDQIRPATLEDFATIENWVTSRYSGKSGCMCGCNGNYKYKSANKELAEKNRGYAISSDEISDRAVNSCFNRLKRELHNGNVKYMLFSNEKEGNIFLDEKGRNNAIYFIKE